MDVVGRAAAAVSAVVFDIGGVLLDWDPRHLYRKVFADHDAMEWFLAHVCTPQWHEAHDRGESTADSCARLAERHPQFAEQIWAWARRSEEMVAGPVVGSVDILEELTDDGVACYALTNMEAETFPLRARRFPFFHRFSGIVVSGIERRAKPDREAFELLLDRFALEPAATVLVDDNAQNVTVASALGMHAVRFVSPPRLRGSLVELGLLTGPAGHGGRRGPAADPRGAAAEAQ